MKVCGMGVLPSHVLYSVHGCNVFFFELSIVRPFKVHEVYETLVVNTPTAAHMHGMAGVVQGEGSASTGTWLLYSHAWDAPGADSSRTPRDAQEYVGQLHAYPALLQYWIFFWCSTVVLVLFLILSYKY